MYKLSLGALKQYCLDNSEIPEDENKCFVSAHQVGTFSEPVTKNGITTIKEIQKINIFFTSKRLLKNSEFVIHIHTDGTYKCIYQGYPVLIVGSTDKCKVFRPFELDLVIQETTLKYEFIHKSLVDLIQRV